MSAVDVLAVMDRLVRLTSVPGEFHPDHPNDLREARAAVSELIGAAENYRIEATGGPGDGNALYFTARKAKRLRAALARCKGES